MFVALDQVRNLLLYRLVQLLWVYPIINYWVKIEGQYNINSGSRSNLCRVTNFLTHNESNTILFITNTLLSRSTIFLLPMTH